MQILDKVELEQRAAAVVATLHDYLDAGHRMFLTSSFQTQSLPLLHMVSRVGRAIPVYFANTGFLFPETIRFAEDMGRRLGLEVIPLQSEVTKVRQMDREGRFLYTSDPDHCCYLNKVQPLEPVLIAHDIWINGIRADQSDTRAGMAAEESAPHGCRRFHPMLDWDSRMIYYYRQQYGLPEHPLEARGYLSIGCEPCTRPLTVDADERSARWYGLNKTECGLHTDLVAQTS